jgi:predicted acylesterase/phospholipase RssA
MLTVRDNSAVDQAEDAMHNEEVRIALVLNGGASLAIWMAGLIHELDLLRRASAGADDPAVQPYDATIAQRWKELCGRDGEPRKIVVDVAAGTSAGGLSASFLATAVASGGTVDPGDADGPWLRERFVELASLEVGKLVPGPDRSTGSVIDGDFFLDQLTEIVTTTAQGGVAAAEPITLLVTASGLGTQQFEAKDAAGHAFNVPDHRFLYAFSSEPKLSYDGSTRLFAADKTEGLGDPAVLARAARASASFPVAFAPVLETDELAHGPQRLLPDQRQVTSGSWLVDGGVLDNAPLGPVLDIVARRPVVTKATRYVLYVVPQSGIEPDRSSPRAVVEPRWTSTLFSALALPREADFLGDVEQLERLLMEADAAWSDTQRLYDHCVEVDAEREALTRAAAILQPTYSRGRVAGGVWEAVMIAAPGRVTVLESVTVSESEVEEVLAIGHPWVPGPDGSTTPLRFGADGTPRWPWGTGAAERVVRLMLRSLRSQLDTAAPADRGEPEKWLEATSAAMQRIHAIRDALTAQLAESGLDLHRDGGAAAVARGLAELFDSLQVQRALGDEIEGLIALVGETRVETALAVEIVSRCTSARTPQQRSAPFKFLRLGPDVGLPVLDGLPEGSTVRELGDRLLYGSQLHNFGAFGASDWRRWDWMIGRLHAVAHLGSMLGADVDWIRETQQAVLAAEGRTLDQLAAQVRKLAQSFPAGAQLAALTAMRDDLNSSAAGRATTTGLADRLITASAGIGPQVGDWAKTLAGRDHRPGGRLPQAVRWVVGPAREAFWRGLVSSPELRPTRRPVLFQWWLPVGGVGVGVLLIVLTHGRAAAAVAGALVVIGGELLAVSSYVARMRRRLGRFVEARMPRL